LKKILTIDDEKEITKSFVTGLAGYGYEVSIYGDPFEALDEFKPNVYELVIIDIGLPRVNGFSIYRRLVEKDKEVKVSFLTNVQVRKNEFDILFPDLHVKFFLTKPLSVPTLMKHLEQVQITVHQCGHASR
jgi:two-component system catabolic regulation response regulator CreB/two-component system response regulator ChvI